MPYLFLIPLRHSWRIFVLCLCCACPPLRTAAAEADFTCFILSDTHAGEDRPKAAPPITPADAFARLQRQLEVMRALPGKAYPERSELEGMRLGAIQVPRGLFVLGDLTDGHKESKRQLQQWAEFEQLCPAQGLRFNDQLVPVFALAGNHDGDVAGPQRQGLHRRNQALRQAGLLTDLSTNSAHFALRSGRIHLLGLGLCPADGTDGETPFKYGQPGAGSWNDPEGALSFLRNYLSTRVENSGDAVILLQHYGFDGFSMNDWNWWTPKQRRALYELLAPYNVALIIHGHNHHAEHYRWPDPKLHAADLPVYFGDSQPAQFRQYDVLSCGSICWVIRFHENRLVAVHLNSLDWPDASDSYFVKALTPKEP